MEIYLIFNFVDLQPFLALLPMKCGCLRQYHSSDARIFFLRPQIILLRPFCSINNLMIKPGEALYVDDIPSSKNCLYGAFICNTRPFAHTKGITFNSTLFYLIRSLLMLASMISQKEAKTSDLAIYLEMNHYLLIL